MMVLTHTENADCTPTLRLGGALSTGPRYYKSCHNVVRVMSSEAQTLRALEIFYIVPYAKTIIVPPTTPRTTASAPEALSWRAPELPDDPALAPLAVAAGGAVAMAPIPPVTGPLSWSVCSDAPTLTAAACQASNVLPVEGALIDLAVRRRSDQFPVIV